MRFVSVGHVTNDLLASGLVPGGSALYAGLAAARLGASSLVVTSHGEDFAGARVLVDGGVTIEARMAARTTCFENVYAGGVRAQRVHAIALPLAGYDGAADVVFLCPVVNEVRAITAPRGALLGAGLQGWLRLVDDDGRVRRQDLDPAAFERCDVVFCSSEDEAPIDALREHVRVVVVTDGPRGARVYAGETIDVPAFPTTEVDPTGAGDVFAAAFLIALRRGESLRDAARYAAAAASIVVEAAGPAALAGLTEPEVRRRAALL